ncbi:MAG TPA: TlyA family RNA methyltransferase [Acidobacteriota bacterium]|nr:TlyA family RNA methyltransferase [Acidobacteriota bacterium]
MPEKRRCLDVLLTDRGLANSRTLARGMIMAGEVYVGGSRADKPGLQFDADAEIEVRSSAPRFASRGGEKLEGALEDFGIDVRGLAALDAGSSTGGFTDCLLQRGAARVYAVDVGRGQLDWRLRGDARVVVLEGKNARYLKPGDLPENPALATLDLSFISLTKVLPAVLPLLAAEAAVLPLVKPQFEAGREAVERGGVVRDPMQHEAALHSIVAFLYNSGVDIVAVAPSRLLGPKGNREFFIHAVKRPPRAALESLEAEIGRAVEG